jgi:hypothetical protein
MSYNSKKAQVVTQSPYINAYTDLAACRLQKLAYFNLPLLKLCLNVLLHRGP